MTGGVLSILVVEDDKAQRDTLGYHLEADGYRVVQSGSGEEALRIVASSSPDLILLAWDLPDMSGVDVCRRLKIQSRYWNLPVIMVSARAAEVDKLLALETGADDYVVKPFSLIELLARVRAHLRRSHPSVVGAPLVCGDITLDPEAHRAFRGRNQIRLGPTEFRLLATMMEHPGRVWSRDTLLDRVWRGGAHVDERTVDAYIRRLRKLLCQFGDDDPLRTVRSAGYALY